MGCVVRTALSVDQRNIKEHSVEHFDNYFGVLSKIYYTDQTS